MNKLKYSLCAASISLGTLFSTISFAETSANYPIPVQPYTAIEQLGDRLYFDTNLSTPAGQACASCHFPLTGYADPNSGFPTSIGAIQNRFGNRNSPTSGYAAHSPDFHFDAELGGYVGGQFWDGRANDLSEQAKGPPLNQLEMNNASKDEIIEKIRQSSYAALFEQVYGSGSLDNAETAYDQMADAIAAFERTTFFNRFATKYDAYLKGRTSLTSQEQRGLALFEGKGQCSQCHTSQPSEDGSPPIFTNFTYANIGVPRNPNNPFYRLPPDLNPDGANFIDLGLGGALGIASENGKFKVPTLRNVAFTRPYMHNGIFNSLNDAVEFHNSRDVGNWPAPEVPENMSNAVGDLGLTTQEVNDIVSFLWALTDGLGYYY